VSSEALDIGDYQVKRIGEKRIVALKISENFIVVLEGAVKEGLIIYYAQQIMNEIKEELLNAVPKVKPMEAIVEAEVEEKPIEALPEEEETAYPIRGAIPKRRVRRLPPELRGERTAARIFREIDGKKTVEAIAKKLGMNLEELWAILVELGKMGVLSIEIPEEVDPKYKRIYKLARDVSFDDIVNEIHLKNEIEMRILLSIYSGNYTIHQLAMFIRAFLGVDITAEDIYKILRRWEREGFVILTSES